MKEHKAAEADKDRKITKTEMHYRDLYDNAPIAYLTISPVDKKIIEFNRQALTFLSINARDLKDRPWNELFAQTAHGREKAEKEFTKCLISRAGSYSDLQMLKSDGNSVWANLSMIPVLDADNNIVEIRAVAIDISKRKQLEDQLEKTQKLEAIATLAGGITHDFNNILSSILGYTELSLIYASKEPKLEDYLKEVYTAGMRAKDLVHQILAFCRPNEQTLMPTRIHLIVKEAMKMLRPTFPSFIDIKCTVKTKAMVLAEPTRIHQLLMNLCTNALYAMEVHGGTLELTLSEIKISEVQTLSFHGIDPGEYVRLEVSDTGTGISPEVIGMIFEPYFTTREKSEGTGLGLSVALGIVKSMNGDIQAKSKEGGGTVFTALLPKIATQDISPVKPAKLLPGGSERILLIDDELPIVKMSTRVLSNSGYHVISETDSREALAYFRSNPKDIDIVITDMTMPSLTGDMLAAEMIRIKPEIPVILCTGNTGSITPETAAKSGIRAILSKPFSREELLTTVRGILDAHPIKNNPCTEKKPWA